MRMRLSTTALLEKYAAFSAFKNINASLVYFELMSVLKTTVDVV